MGAKLFDQVTGATGLPQDLVAGELEQLLKAAGMERTELTIDELRNILAEYVQDVLVAAKESLAAEEKTSSNVNPPEPFPLK